jgi:hypothetical protein
MPSALCIEGLWKSYTAGVRGCSARVWVLRGLSLAIERGERVAIVGARGAGKTTLAACVLGLLQPDAGVIDAPALHRGELAVIGPGRWLELPAATVDSPATTLILTSELACVRAWVDRALLLRDGLVHPMVVRAPVRRVAECWAEIARAGDAFR